MEYINENSTIYSFIKDKYNEFNEDTLIKFFKNDFYSKLDLSYESIKTIIEIINKFLKLENINFEDIVYLGYGQSFGVLKLKDIVIKIGKDMDIDYSDYVLDPLYEHHLENGISLYASPYANNKKVTHKDTLEMYEEIKRNGGLWIDPKDNNLGFVENTNYRKIFNIDYELDINKAYLVDYGDLIILNEDNKDYYIDIYGNDLDKKYLSKTNDYNEIYYRLFIQRRNDLLEIEKEIAIRNNDFDSALACELQQRKNLDGKTNYYDPEYHSDDFEYSASQELINAFKKQKFDNFIGKFKKGR